MHQSQFSSFQAFCLASIDRIALAIEILQLVLVVEPFAIVVVAPLLPGFAAIVAGALPSCAWPIHRHQANQVFSKQITSNLHQLRICLTISVI